MKFFTAKGAAEKKTTFGYVFIYEVIMGDLFNIHSIPPS